MTTKMLTSTVSQQPVSQQPHSTCSDALDGRWQLVSMLADGPVTRLFHARPANTPSDRPVSYVVKLLHSQWWDDPETIRRFDRESRIGRTISNRHLISILEGQTDRPPYYLVMPYLEGVTLEQLMRQAPQPDVSAILWFARQVTEALDAIDQAQCVHGDVKPGNILVSPTGHTTLLDLGFARRRDDRRASAERCVAGTVRYMAPELLVPGTEPDSGSGTESGIASDLYSLGVILYEALTGHLPYDAVDLHHLAILHRQHRPCSVRELAPELPDAVAELVHSLISLDPTDRLSSPRSLIRQLIQLEIKTFGTRHHAPAPQ
jgi:serine/threonine protein kinase